MAIVAGFSWAMAMGAILYLAAAGLAHFGFQDVGFMSGLGTQM